MDKKIVIVLLICFMIIACQPTPETAAIVNKREDYLQEAGKKEEQFSVPNDYTKEADPNAKVLIDFHADVNYVSEEYPILQVRPRAFNETDLQSMCSYLTPNTTLYEEIEPTKDEIAEQLATMQNYDGSLGSFVDVSEFDLLKQELIDSWNTTEDNTLLIPYEFDRKIDSPLLFVVNGFTEQGQICKYTMNPKSNQFAFLRDRNIFIYPANSVRGIDIDSPCIDEQNARTVAESFLEHFCSDSYTLAETDRAFVMRFYSKQETAWRFVFIRSIKNTETIQQTPYLRLDKNSLPSIGAPWPPEQLIIDVDSYGILSIVWSGASMICSTLVEDCKFESFDTIIQRFDNQMLFQLSGQNIGADYKFYINVKEINLCYGLLSEENDQDSGRYVPLWEFVYDFGFENDAEDELDEEKIYFNAVDGSYVEPRVTNQYLFGILS